MPPKKSSQAPYAIRHTTLQNGLRVVAIEAPHLSTAYVALLVNLGSRHERPEHNGLSHFLEHMVFRGTANYGDVQDLNMAVEAIGGSLDAATYRDHTHYGTIAHPSKIRTAIDLVGEIATSPRFRFIETERRIIKEEMRESFGTRGQMVDVDTLSHWAIYGAHPLGQAIEGTPRLLDTFTGRHLRTHHRTHYAGKNCVVVLAGKVSLTAQKAALDKAFLAMPVGAYITSRPPPPRAAEPKFQWVDDSGAQVDIRISFPGVSARAKELPAMLALSRVFAEGLSSRLQAELVDKRGLAYSLSAGPEVFADAGSFDFDVTVAPEKAEETVAAIMKFARHCVKHPPTPAELAEAKSRYRIAADFMRDAPGELGLWIGRALLLGAEHDPEAVARAYYAVTPAECAALTPKVFDPAAVVLCGVGALSARRQKAIARLVA